MKCLKCNETAVKNGKQFNGKQRYYCKNCAVSFQSNYSYRACNKNVNKKIYLLLKEGVGILSTSRLLSISKTTVINRIKHMSKLVKNPIIQEFNQYYEVDEMKVVVEYKQNESWLTYAINRDTKQVIDFVVGRRTKSNLFKVINTTLQTQPKYIFTDKLPSYKSLIPKEKHNNQKKNTTIIERNNLTLRTHLKRLSRKTICYSKNFEMLKSVLKLYFWGHSLVL